MYKPNPSGFHTSLNEEVIARIIPNVRRGLAIGVIAGVSKVPKENLRRWLNRGKEDAQNGQDSIFAQLWVKFEAERNEEILTLLEFVRGGKKNWMGPWELVKAVAREDFGTEATEYKELVEMFAKLSQDFKQLTQGNPKDLGGSNDGRKMDSEGKDQEGSPA